MKNALLSRVTSHFWILFLFALVIPLFFSLQMVFSGNIPFWYDNARDMLMAWDNLQKITLIGPTSGIPGIFYGPYWIWTLSLGLFFSKDPRSAAIVAGIIPYFIVFPIFLFGFSSVLRRSTLLIIWLLFILSTGIGYATNLWNPNLAPLLFLVLLYLFTSTDYSKITKPSLLKTLSAGCITGLIINFHISFGIGIFIGAVMYFLLTSFLLLKNLSVSRRIILIILLGTAFGVGVAVTFLPFLLFEARHGFMQTTTAINALTKYGAVVTIKGLTKQQILEQFFGRISILLHTPKILLYPLIFGLTAYGVYLAQKKRDFLSTKGRQLLYALLCSATGVLFVYLTAHNPVWEYHFVGTEIIFLFLLALIINKSIRLKSVLSVWIVLFSLPMIFSFISAIYTNPLTRSSLYTKEYIAQTVLADAKSASFTAFAYSPSIYQYDYSYLFRWKGDVNVPFDPGQNPNSSPLVYIITPRLPEKEKSGYINYRTPNSIYKTLRVWNIADGTTITKRTRN
jgi:hypothetical protein